jgi:hypothetical protein
VQRSTRASPGPHRASQRAGALIARPRPERSSPAAAGATSHASTVHLPPGPRSSRTSSEQRAASNRRSRTRQVVLVAQPPSRRARTAIAIGRAKRPIGQCRCGPLCPRLRLRLCSAARLAGDVRNGTLFTHSRRGDLTTQLLTRACVCGIRVCVCALVLQHNGSVYCTERSCARARGTGKTYSERKKKKKITQKSKGKKRSIAPRQVRERASESVVCYVWASESVCVGEEYTK